MTALSTLRLVAVVGLVSTLCAAAAGCRSDTGEAPSETTDATAPTTDATPVTTTTRVTTPSATDGPTATAPTSTTTRAPAPSTTTTTLPWSLPQELARQVEELMGVTETLRGRTFARRPSFEAVTPEELAERTPDPSRESRRESVRWQSAFFELLGMPADADLGAVLAALAAPVPEPFYDFARARVVIPTGGAPLDEYQKWVLVGELVHALAHQRNPLVVGNLSAVGQDPDRLAARIALLEGEALLVQSLYLDSLPPERRAQAAGQVGERYRSVLDEAPSMLRELARFPSRAGSFLAAELYRLGGMAALDQALDRPPNTTEQVLHIDRYRRLEPGIEVDPPAVEVEGYTVVEQGTWGERRWKAMLDRHSGTVAAARAADGWGGDHYQILWEPDTGGLVFVIRYAADSFADESEMNAAIRNLITSGMQIGSSRVFDTVTEWVEGADYAMLAWDVDVITFLIASDPEVGRLVVRQIGVGT